jgi:hypothetical protein
MTPLSFIHSRMGKLAPCPSCRQQLARILRSHLHRLLSAFSSQLASSRRLSTCITATSSARQVRSLPSRWKKIGKSPPTTLTRFDSSRQNSNATWLYCWSIVRNRNALPQKLDFQWDFYVFRDSTWQANRQNGALSLMPNKQLETLQIRFQSRSGICAVPICNGVAQSHYRSRLRRNGYINLRHLVPMVHMMRIHEIRRTHKISTYIIGCRSRSGMAHFSRRRRRQVKRHRYIRQRSDQSFQWIETHSAPGGTVTFGFPSNVNSRSVPTSIAADEVATGRAICTEVNRSASVPNVFERCTRSAVPPTDR